MSEKIALRKRYSLCFKLKVVEDIESGKYTNSEAMRHYDVTGGDTIRRWLNAYGKNKVITKTVGIIMPNEYEKIKKLEEEKKELEAALSQSYLKILRLESTIKVAKQYYGEDFEKKSDTKVLKKPKKK